MSGFVSLKGEPENRKFYTGVTNMPQALYLTIKVHRKFPDRPKT